MKSDTKRSDKVIETPRLIMRQWRDSDIEPMTAIGQDPKVMEHFVSLRTKQDTLDFIENARALYDQVGYCQYAVELKNTGELMGFVGLSPIEINMPFAPGVEIGWQLASKF